MKDLLMFYLDDCGYCHKAHQAMEELMAENPAYQKLHITKVEESRDPAFADQFDYYAVPSFFMEGEKLFEAHIGMSYDDIKNEVRKVLDKALA